MLSSFPWLLALLVAFGLVAGCAVNPVTGRQEVVLMSEQDEIALGNQAATEVAKEYAPCHLPGLQEYVNQVGQRLAPHSHRPNLQYSFTVVDSPEVNAFALPGGHIYVTRGILAYLNSEAELAGVLGHEIGHVTAILGSVLESKTGLAASATYSARAPPLTCAATVATMNWRLTAWVPNTWPGQGTIHKPW